MKLLIAVSLLIAVPCFADSTTYKMSDTVTIEENDDGTTTTHYKMSDGVTIRSGEDSGTDYDMGSVIISVDDD